MNLLKRNVGTADQILRIGFGLLMIYFGFIDKSFVTDELGSILLGCFGIIILLSGAFARCPLYNVIDFNTCNKDKS